MLELLVVLLELPDECFGVAVITAEQIINLVLISIGKNLLDLRVVVHEPENTVEVTLVHDAACVRFVF